MLSVADDHFFDFFERSRIHEHAPGRHGGATLRALLREFDGLAVFQQKNFFRNGAQLVRQRRVAEKVPVFAVNRNEIFRLDQLQNQFLLFLAGVARNVNQAARIVVIHQRAPAEHVIEHAKDGFFVARNDARGKNDRVIFIDGNVAVIVHGNARERGHRLGLAAAGENHQAPGIEAANVLRPHDHAVGNLQQAERVRNFDVVNHVASDKGHLAVDANGNVKHLLNAVNRRRKTRQNHAARRRTGQFFDARHHRAFRRREARTLHVGGIAEEREHAFAAVFGESVQIKGRAVDRSLIDFEIPSVDDHAKRRADGQRHAIQRAVGYGNEFDFEWADFDRAAGQDFAQRGGIEQARFFHALFHERQREARSVQRNIQIAKNVRQRADVIFMAVRQHNRANLRPVLLEVGNVRNDQVDAQKLGLREHHARVDDDDVVAEPQHHHVHAEFTEPPERNGGEGPRCFVGAFF